MPVVNTSVQGEHSPLSIGITHSFGLGMEHHFQGLHSSLVGAIAGPGRQLKPNLDGLQARLQVIAKAQRLQHHTSCNRMASHHGTQQVRMSIQRIPGMFPQLGASHQAQRQPFAPHCEQVTE